MKCVDRMSTIRRALLTSVGCMFVLFVVSGAEWLRASGRLKWGGNREHEDPQRYASGIQTRGVGDTVGHHRYDAVGTYSRYNVVAGLKTVALDRSISVGSCLES